MDALKRGGGGSSDAAPFGFPFEINMTHRLWFPAENSLVSLSLLRTSRKKSKRGRHAIKKKKFFIDIEIFFLFLFFSRNKKYLYIFLNNSAHCLPHIITVPKATLMSKK